MARCLVLLVIAALAAPLAPAGQADRAPLAAADAAMRAGRFADAVREYEAWLVKHPNAESVLLALGTCYVQLGRQSDAVATLRRYVRLAPKSAAGRAALGIALLDGARTAEAKAELETAIRLDPKQSDAAEALARIYVTEGRGEAAVTLLEPLVSAAPTDARRALLADALVRAGRARAAGEMLEREIEANRAAAPRIYATAAWAFLEAGDRAKAADICERGMRLYPDSEIAAVYLSLPAPVLAERIGARIKRLQEAPDVAELVAVGRVLVDADPARKTRALEIAERMLAHAIQLAPDNASARYNYGRALVERSVESALVEWERALALAPAPELRLQVLTKAAAAHLDRADYEAAERAYREALEVNRGLPTRVPEAALDYARFLQLRSRNDEAAALVEEVLRWSPFSPRAHLELAKLLAVRGQWERVVEAGEFALRNAGGDRELERSAHALLARAYLRMNKPEKAREHRAWIESQ